MKIEGQNYIKLYEKYVSSLNDERVSKKKYYELLKNAGETGNIDVKEEAYTACSEYLEKEEKTNKIGRLLLQNILHLTNEDFACKNQDDLYAIGKG